MAGNMWTEGYFLALLVCTILATETFFDSCPSSACSCVAPAHGSDVIVTCSEQQLVLVPDIASSKPVTSLGLSHNKLTLLDNTSFIWYDALKYLDLSHNEIETIEQKTFYGLSQLEELDLSLNNLLNLHPKIFSYNPLLKTVDLSGNQRLYIPQSSPFIVSSSMLSLDLSSCRLSYLYPETFSQLPKLHNLDLSSNNLRIFPLRILEDLTNIKILGIENNPWQCSCELVTLLEWIGNLEHTEGHNVIHRPARCLKDGMYQTLISESDRGKICQNIRVNEGVTVTSIQNTTSGRTMLDFDIIKDLDYEEDDYTSIIQEVESLDEMVMEERTETVRDLLSWNVFQFFIVISVILGAAVIFSVLAVYLIVHIKSHKPEKIYWDTKSSNISRNDNIYSYEYVK